MSKRRHISAVINGEAVDFLCEPRQSLLEIIRDELLLTGTKEGCNDGNCGACNVTLDGTLVNSCCVLAVEIDGKSVETIEGMASEGNLHPLQEAMLRETGLQCGICTPGILISSRELLRHNPEPTDEQVRLWLAGNLCRCTGYDRIVSAVQKAAAAMRDGG